MSWPTGIGNRPTPEYLAWWAMLDRCQNPENKKYHLYGGRGVTVCARWQSYQNFMDDMGKKPVGTSLDRVDNLGGYNRENCRWATASEQNKNRRRVGFTYALWKQAVSLKATGISVRQVSLKLGRNHQQVGRWLVMTEQEARYWSGHVVA